MSAALGEKRLAVLHDLVPRSNVLGLIVNPNNANAQANVKNAREAARALGVQSVVVNAASEAEYEGAISALLKHDVQAALVLNDPLFSNKRAGLLNIMARNKIPAMYPSREFVDAGGLVSYGANIADAHRQAGGYAGRILKGEKPAELPVMQASKFELVINANTAKILGFTVPDRVIALADEVIE